MDNFFDFENNFPFDSLEDINDIDQVDYGLIRQRDLGGAAAAEWNYIVGDFRNSLYTTS